MLLVLQIEDRHDELLESMIRRNIFASKKYGFAHVFLERSTEYNVPQYWSKVFELSRLMHANKDYDLFMWIDSDATFRNLSEMNPEALASKFPTKHMWISPDAPMYPSPFCAGSFLVRNTVSGRAIIDKWKSLYDPSMWTKTDGGKWVGKCEFASHCYEQGAFVDFFLSDGEVADDSWGIQKLPYFFFNEVLCDNPNPECLTFHLAGKYKKTCDCSKAFSKEPFVEESTNFGLAIAVLVFLIVLVFMKKMKSVRSNSQ